MSFQIHFYPDLMQIPFLLFKMYFYSLFKINNHKKEVIKKE